MLYNRRGISPLFAAETRVFGAMTNWELVLLTLATSLWIKSNPVAIKIKIYYSLLPLQKPVPL